MLDQLGLMLASPMLQRSLLVAFVVGLSAPVIGTFLVQRRLSLLGDGVGHVALTGVALGWLVGAAVGATEADAYAIPGAIVVSIAGSVLIEIVRVRGRTSGDTALALLFYGGIAGGVVVMGLAGGTNANLMAYLFGSLSTVTPGDVVQTLLMAALILGVGLWLRTALFAVSHDEEFARASGLPVATLNILVAVMAAVTVTVSMRVVGLLLVSALMIVPVAIAQLLTRSFRTTMHVAMGIGAAVCVAGLLVTFFVRLAPGAVIVALAILVYAALALARPLLRRRHGRRAGAPEPALERSTA
ncbi:MULTISPECIES: metal ABC transporter permease [unclassified Pseudactinotalea]|uniref:metal ABC transporter permease n=1 Tax=unclassified Pseudactinotalea TaxID=2649176 RepID=UPI00128AE6F1|nr:MULTISPECIES: metal ABC transporter permease [unclassified Pseudactinotalea]MPV49781.1 iron chelate uptake ABC transporter family permease subunit [Pseudactinotalea sp. HY160]QGH70993.1 iron chelate uptake ABC transporter family permease subunit [Pseudactinotalea sp. HY158]